MRGYGREPKLREWASWARRPVKAAPPPKQFRHAPAQMRRFAYLVVTAIMLELTFAALQLHWLPGPLG